MLAHLLRLFRSKPLVGSLTSLTLLSSVGATPLDDVQTAATTWANLRSELARLENDWTAEKKVLTASVTGLTQRVEQMNLSYEALEAETSKDRRELDEMREENETTSAGLIEANNRMATIAQRLIAIRPALPPRLLTALDLPFKSLASPDIAAGERAQHVMTVLNRCNQFNQAFVLAEEIIPTSPGAEPQLLETIYLGLAQGCAIDRAANKAYIGRPINGTWTWTHDPDLASEVANMIAIYQDRAEPTFVTMPVQVTGGDQ